MSKFSVVIPAYRDATIAVAIESIICQTWPNWELIIVGQGNANSIEAVVDKYSDDNRVRYINIRKNGTCRARNAGIDMSNGEIIAFIDDDCEAEPAWLETLAQVLDSNLDLGLVGGALLPARAKLRSGPAVCPAMLPSEAIYDPVLTPYQPPKGWDWIGCSVAIRREIFSKAGYFDEYLGPGTEFPAGEDTDYKLRLEKLGIKMASTPRAIVVHSNGYRYGFQAVVRNSRNYAYGNSGLAGKLTLLGDFRGIEWMQAIRQECISGWFPRFYRLPIKLFRLYNSYSAYKKCLRNYKIVDGLLSPKEQNIFGNA